ncbi:TolC family outer membrane protein [Devosia sp. MC532]|uniref:TolC family outer membrane protein n=1 Tax=unclassified Devosia TaxID=196773 RepID=UPI0018F62BF2|nr:MULTISPECIES: TolC family outer membrane protein [unclassified Devosia]MBJ7576639.1 TolC family outer membrane protein [Devosia sp. MC532]MBK1795758.1 TolC family outer membrane protein [Devosia sp. WQ 349K1]
MMKFTGFLKVSALALAVAVSSVGTTQAQSIAEALARAYEHAPELQSALLNAQSQAENIVTAKSAKLPTISGSFGASESISNATGQTLASGSHPVIGSQFNAGLRYDQTLFDNFKSDAQIEQARAGAEAAEYQLRNTEQNVLLNVVQAYMDVLRFRELVSLRQENIAFFQAQLRSAQDRLEVGEGTRIDVAQAQARAAQGQAAFRAAQGSLETAEATFQRYVGVRPQGLSAGHNFARLLPNSIDGAIAEAEIGHPAILLAKASIRAAQAGADIAAASGGPTASLTGQVGGALSVGNRNNTGTGTLSGSVGINVAVPIYSGGRIGAAVRQANLGQIKSEVDAMSTYDQIRQAVISAWSGIQSADAQIQAAQAAVAASNTVLEGVIQERDLGTRTTLDVLNSQADLTSARESLITASSQKTIATFSLLSATGRLTAANLGLGVATKTAVPYTQAVEDVWQELRTIPQ